MGSVQVFIENIKSEDLAHFDVNTLWRHVISLLHSFETPFCCSLEQFPKHFFPTFLQLRVLNSYQNNYSLLKNS